MDTLSQAEFEEYVIEEELPSIVLFSRKSCHVCQAVHPIIEELESDTPDVKFYHVDVEDEPGLFQKYGGKGVPQVISFRGGELVKRLAGQQEEDDYMDQVEEIRSLDQKAQSGRM